MQKLNLQAVGHATGWRLSGVDMEFKHIGQDSSSSASTSELLVTELLLSWSADIVPGMIYL